MRVRASRLAARPAAPAALVILYLNNKPYVYIISITKLLFITNTCYINNNYLYKQECPNSNTNILL